MADLALPAARSRSIAAGHVSANRTSGSSGGGSVANAHSRQAANSVGLRYCKQLGKVAKKSLEECTGQITHLFMARASAMVVQSTSVTDGLMNT